ncbi:hypothetical protein [Vibrio proteolyticus]
MITKKDIEYIVTFVAIVIVVVYLWDEFTDGWKFLITISATVVASIVISVAFIWISNYLSSKSMGTVERKAKKEGVDLENSDPEEVKKLVLILDDFASSEKLTNRVTDAVGYLVMFFSWLVMLGCIAGYGYFLFISISKSEYGDWILLWLPVAYYVIFEIFGLFIAVACKVFFNRYPFEARRIRKHIDKNLGHILYYKPQKPIE